MQAMKKGIVIDMEQQIIQPVSPVSLLSEVLKLKDTGYRLVAITCTNKEDLELSYSFDKDYELITLRINTDSKTEISSISSLYPYSFLYENEIKELFGANIVHINLDFNDTLYKIPVKTPFAKKEGDE
jgi:Respiratory-chain NADH dehydrogenase, 30 Kd subunit.